MTKRRQRALLGIGLASMLAPWLLLAIGAALTPLPESLRQRASYGESLRILDRHGELLRHVRASDGSLSQPLRLSEISPHVVPALLAAEDRRFFHHPGIDPLSMLRAFGQALWHRQLVSGASTLTQQLARQVVARPRTVRGKLGEMALALRIEASLSKEEILEEYLRRAPFGPNIRGIEAASRAYLDKPAKDLSLAEAAFLVSLPRGPTLYDPRRGLDRPKRRRDRVIERMVTDSLASREEADRALGEPLALTAFHPPVDATHFVQAVVTNKLGDVPAAATEVATTLDPALEREAEAAVRGAVAELADRHVSAASVIVLDNATGDILAYVGSPDPASLENLGANDGVRALRQPGSSLKPLVYELAMEDLGWTAATLLPDVEMHLPSDGGDFVPHDYDGHFHGPVRLREALASSLNVPAVYTASVLGPARVLERLHALGLASLTLDADHYGAAIALGDGEITLLELAAAYSTLARGGNYLAPRAVRSVLAGGARVSTPPAEARHVLDRDASDLVTSVLSDDRARMSSFGENSVLDLEFPVAAKTGTSKGYRDNIAVGFTREVTVAAWVGNFDGSPMRDVSGITGAGPIFRDVMRAAMSGRERASLASSRFESVEVCALSGELPGDDCAHRRTELFLPGTAPSATCSMHAHVRVDRSNELLAGPACAGADTLERTVEIYPPEFLAWAAHAGRPLLPNGVSPRCPTSASDHHAASSRAPRVVYPIDGARFVHDDSVASAQQRIVLRAEAVENTPVRFVVDGTATIVRNRPLSLSLPMKAGVHHVWAEAGDLRSDEVSFSVE